MTEEFPGIINFCVTFSEYVCMYTCVCVCVYTHTYQFTSALLTSFTFQRVQNFDQNVEKVSSEEH